MDSQIQRLKDMDELIEDFKSNLPEAYKARDEFNDEVYKDGALSAKTKRLMAMSIAVRIECTSCIIFQTKLAVEAGATKREVVEAASVASAMGGTSASSGLWIVVQTMKDLGKW
jgi:AhpD family alkylhydroperoxidase